MYISKRAIYDAFIASANFNVNPYFIFPRSNFLKKTSRWSIEIRSFVKEARFKSLCVCVPTKRIRSWKRIKTVGRLLRKTLSTSLTTRRKLVYNPNLNFHVHLRNHCVRSILASLEKEILSSKFSKITPSNFSKSVEEDPQVDERPGRVYTRTHAYTHTYIRKHTYTERELISRNCLNARVIESRSAEIGLAAWIRNTAGQHFRLINRREPAKRHRDYANRSPIIDDSEHRSIARLIIRPKVFSRPRNYRNNPLVMTTGRRARRLNFCVVNLVMEKEARRQRTWLINSNYF